MADKSHSLEMTYEQARALFRYDPKSGRLFWKERPREMFSDNFHWKMWNGRYAGKRAFNLRGSSYRRVTVMGVTILAHRLIWLMQTGNWPEGHVDHINGVKKDNRWENLRDVPHAVNMRNRGLTKSNKSGVNGVRQVGLKWEAQIRADGKTVFLGRFPTIEAATEARHAANRQYGFSERHGT